MNKYRLDYYIKNGNALLIRGSELLDKMQKHAKETREVETYWYKADGVADLAKRCLYYLEPYLESFEETTGYEQLYKFIAELGQIAGK